jgi:DNA-binding transcriptional LysR family regulator
MLNNIDLARADLNLLVLFDTVFEERHVGRAADRMNLTASAVSHGLGRLRRLLNDPLFLKTPKGVVPTVRARELAAAVSDVLARARSVISTAAPFDAATSTRRFRIGAPDSVSAVFLPDLLPTLSRHAPGVEIALRQLLPAAGEVLPERAWRNAFAELEAQQMDIAIIPTDVVPARFSKQTLCVEDFVLAMRKGHPAARRLTSARYCALRHVVVSMTGDPYGFVDRVLEELGLSRRVALTVPNSLFALAVVGESDMVAALPRRFVARHAARFGVTAVKSPVDLGSFRLNVVAPQVAMMDAGIAWLFGKLAG